ncbi:MAG: flippase-like domain-containing protein [Anaerolineae bacterium]|nr:flippase-like domain-containing protein [Anaerolineae bacterium]
MGAPRGRRASWWRWLPGLAIGGIACLLLLREVDWAGVAATLGGMRVPWALAALLASVATVVAKALRWRSLAGPKGKQVGVRAFVAMELAGLLLNQALPAHLGDGARAFLLGRAQQAYGEAASSVLVEKAMDSLVLLALLGALLPFVPFPPWLRAGGLAFGLGFLVALAGLLVLGLVPLERAVPWVPLRAWLEGKELLLGMRVGLRWYWRAWAPWAWTLLVWLLGGLTNGLAFWALGLPLGGVAAALVLAVLYLGRAIPQPPAQVGVFQVLCIAALAPFGVPREEALGFGILLHLVVLIPLALGGLWGLGYAGHLWPRWGEAWRRITGTEEGT